MAKSALKTNTAPEVQDQAGFVRKVPDYTEDFRASMVATMLMPGGPSANALSMVCSVSQPTLSRWKREALARLAALEMGDSAGVKVTPVAGNGGGVSITIQFPKAVPNSEVKRVLAAVGNVVNKKT